MQPSAHTHKQLTLSVHLPLPLTPFLPPSSPTPPPPTLQLPPSSKNTVRHQATHSLMQVSVGISDQRRAYLTGLTCSWGSRSTCMCSIRRQNDARRSGGSDSSAMHLSTHHLSVQWFRFHPAKFNCSQHQNRCHLSEHLCSFLLAE